MVGKQEASCAGGQKVVDMPPADCVTLGKSFNLPELQSSQCAWNTDNEAKMKAWVLKLLCKFLLVRENTIVPGIGHRQSMNTVPCLNRDKVFMWINGG
jgi:hypothetical protein